VKYLLALPLADHKKKALPQVIKVHPCHSKSTKRSSFFIFFGGVSDHKLACELNSYLVHKMTNPKKLESLIWVFSFYCDLPVLYLYN
jgi:hypothetical protein